MAMRNPLRDALLDIRNRYEGLRQAPATERVQARQDVELMLNAARYEVLNVIQDKHRNKECKVSSGYRNYPCQAWIAILDPEAASNPETGYFVSYLISSYQPSKVILSLLVGFDEQEREMVGQGLDESEILAKIRERRDLLREFAISTEGSELEPENSLVQQCRMINIESTEISLHCNYRAR